MRAEIDDFICYLATERGLSDTYQISTRRTLESFTGWVEKVHHLSDPRTITLAHLHDYLAHRKRAGLAAAATGLPLWFVERDLARAVDQAVAQSASPNNRPGLALIGCGGRGTGAAANALATKSGPTRLVAMADALTENFQPGTLEQWGLGWDVLREINPRLVMLRVSGYGQTGPYSHKPGFGRIGNAFGGISFLAGDPDGPPVTPGSATLADYMAGLYGALGVLMALRSRDATGHGTGKGQQIDIGLYEPIFRILDEMAPAYEKPVNPALVQQAIESKAQIKRSNKRLIDMQCDPGVLVGGRAYSILEG